MRTSVISRQEARDRLRRDPSAATQAEYEDALRALKPDHCVEIAPDEGESLRGIKLRLTRAATLTGVRIDYAESEDNSVIAWLAERRRHAPATRRRRKEEQTNGTA